MDIGDKIYKPIKATRKAVDTSTKAGCNKSDVGFMFIFGIIILLIVCIL